MPEGEAKLSTGGGGPWCLAVGGWVHKQGGEIKHFASERNQWGN